MIYHIPIFQFWVGFLLLAGFSAAVSWLIARRKYRSREQLPFKPMATYLPSILREQAE